MYRVPLKAILLVIVAFWSASTVHAVRAAASTSDSFEIVLRSFTNGKLGADISSFVPAGTYDPINEFEICLNAATVVTTMGENATEQVVSYSDASSISITDDQIVSQNQPLASLPAFYACCPTLPPKYIEIKNNSYYIAIPKRKLNKASCGFEWIRLPENSGEARKTSVFDVNSLQTGPDALYGSLSDAELYKILRSQTPEHGTTAFPNTRVFPSHVKDVDMILRNRFLFPSAANISKSNNSSSYVKVERSTEHRPVPYNRTMSVQHIPLSTTNSQSEVCKCDITQRIEKVGFTANMSIKLHCSQPFESCSSVSTEALTKDATCDISLLQIVSPFMFGDPYEQQMHEFETKQSTQLFDFVDVENMGEESRATVVMLSPSVSPAIPKTENLEDAKEKAKREFGQSTLNEDGSQTAVWRFPLHTKYALPPTESQDHMSLLAITQPLGSARRLMVRQIAENGKQISGKYDNRNYYPITVMPPEFEVLCSSVSDGSRQSFPFIFEQTSFIAEDHDIDELDASFPSELSSLSSKDGESSDNAYFASRPDSALMYLPVGRMEHFSFVAIGTATATIAAAFLIARTVFNTKFE